MASKVMHILLKKKGGRCDEQPGTSRADWHELYLASYSATNDNISNRKVDHVRDRILIHR